MIQPEQIVVSVQFRYKDGNTEVQQFAVSEFDDASDEAIADMICQLSRGVIDACAAALIQPKDEIIH